MRLFLAVAVLMLALVAHSAAQEETIEQRFQSFGQQMQELGQQIADKTQAAFKDVHQSQFAADTRNWFENLGEKIKAKANELIN